jgi:RNA polymerase sigma factor (sigma-70 family)
LFFKKKISNLTDNELLEKYRQDGKSVWLGELYNRYSHLVFGLCLKYLKDEESAKDAVLNIFEKLIVELRDREVATFQHWLYAVSKNHCLMILRNEGREAKRKVVYHHEISAHVVEAHDILSHSQMREAGLLRLEAAIQRLNDEQRECITLFYLKEKSYKEIVEATGYNMGEVKSHLQNGRRNLRLILEATK